MQNKYWHSELKRIVFYLAVIGLIGFMAGQLLVVVLIAVVVYLSWHLFNIYRLLKWLEEGKRTKPPKSYGVWSDLHYLLNILHLRHQKRKKRLVQLANRFQDATLAMPDGVVALGKHGEIEWFNNSARELLGLKSSSDTGRSITHIIHNPNFIEQLDSHKTQEKYQIKSPQDSRITLQIQFVPYAKKQLLMIVSDISQQEMLEQMRKDFIANVSHELRTPLTVINGFVETMVDTDDKGLKPWKDSLTLVEQQSHRMQKIIEDLLLLSRLEKDYMDFHPENIDIPLLLQSIVESSHLLAKEKNQTITLECEDVYLNGVESEIYSAFNNLVINAIRYTPDKGEVTIKWFEDNEGKHFCVSDSGIGIAEKNIARLTERFYRVDVGRSRDSGGTGLGLAIVKHVLNRHNANLAITSEVNKGSVFCCFFPVE